MSNMIRKYKRSIFKSKHPRCCGEKMRRKPYYDTETQTFYFCEICGKEKYVSQEDA